RAKDARPCRLPDFAAAAEGAPLSLAHPGLVDVHLAPRPAHAGSSGDASGDGLFGGACADAGRLFLCADRSARFLRLGFHRMAVRRTRKASQAFLFLLLFRFCPTGAGAGVAALAAPRVRPCLAANGAADRCKLTSVEGKTLWRNIPRRE